MSATLAATQALPALEPGCRHSSVRMTKVSNLKCSACRIKEGEQLSAAQAQVAGLEQAVAQAQAGLAKRFEALDAAAQVTIAVTSNHSPRQKH